MDWLKLLPAIGTFIGGPAGTIAGAGIEWLASKLGAPASTLDAIKQTLSGFTPDRLIEMKKLDIDFEEFCRNNKIQLDLAQIRVNEVEANSTNWFVAGWRPFVGWMCGVALAYAAILEPLMRFVALVIFKYSGVFPAIDTNLTMQVLIGLLGLGGMRAYEKVQGVAR